MTEAITVKKVVTQPFFAMTCFLLVCFILPRYGGGIATMVGCAGILSVHVAVLPEQFRSRSGSLMPATCLVAVLWAFASVITAQTLMGEIRN